MNKQNSLKLILLVEDEALIAMTEAELLEKHGYKVETVSSGKKAIEAVKNSEIDLILMDIDLGKDRMDGTEAAEIILEENDIPIVFLSGHTEPEVAKKTEGITSYGFIVKNSGETVLITSIKMAFRLFESRKIYRDTFESSINGLCIHKMIYDEAGKAVDCEYVKVNSSFEAHTGLSSEDLIGRTIRDIYPADEAKEVIDLYSETVMSGTSTRRELYFEPLQSWFELSIFPMQNHQFTVAVQNISERIEKSRKLHESETTFRTLIDILPVGVTISDAEGKITTSNDMSEKLLGLSEEEQVQRKINGQEWRIIRKDGTLMPVEEYASTRALKENRFIEGVEMGIVKGTGETTWINVNAAPIPLDGYGVAIAYNDISEHVRMTRELKKTITAKDVLMKELNHRVKNNLIMVNSLIRLKGNTLGNKIDLSDLTHQIDAIRIIHEKLYQSENITHISVKEHLQDLLSKVFSFSNRPFSIDLNVDVETLHTKTAIPLGLIINEIATNAMKHGFTDKGEARFQLHLIRDKSEKQYSLTLSNAGNPFPKDIDLNNPATLGLQLISALVGQLKGTIELQREPHPVFTIKFPAEENLK